MENWLTIIIEIGILAFILLLYYVFQRRRIIHRDIEEIFLVTDDIIYKIHQYLDNKQGEGHYQELNNFVTSLEKCTEQHSIEELIKALMIRPSHLPTDINQRIEVLDRDLNFYKK